MKQRVYTFYYDNGNILREIYYLGDVEATKNNIHSFKYHRTDGPANIGYAENGKKEDEAWYVDDKYNKADGPARIWYNEDGKIEREKWYINGKELNEEEISKIKIMIELNKEVLK